VPKVIKIFVIGFQDTVENVWDVFFGTQCTLVTIQIDNLYLFTLTFIWVSLIDLYYA